MPLPGNYDAWKTRYPSFDLSPVSLTAIDTDGGKTPLLTNAEVNGSDVADDIQKAWDNPQVTLVRVERGRSASEDFDLEDYAYAADLSADVADYIDAYESDDDYYEED